MTCFVVVALLAQFGCGGAADSPAESEPELEFDCPSTSTVATVSDLNYPSDCETTTDAAVGQLDSGHYRRACEEADPGAPQPPAVESAHVTQCRPTEERGVFLDVELCCDAKVFDESEFRELVWQRPLEEVRAALGEPLQVTEWPQGTHWSFPLEVARDDQVFPEVTVVIVDDRVKSYHF